MSDIDVVGLRTAHTGSREFVHTLDGKASFVILGAKYGQVCELRAAVEHRLGRNQRIKPPRVISLL